MATKFLDNGVESQENELKKTLAPRKPLDNQESNSQEELLIKRELKELPRQLSASDGFSILTCHRQMVQISIYCSTFRQLTISFQYPVSDYPLKPVLIELKSKTISQELLKGLLLKCDTEVESFRGVVHIHKICLFVRRFLEENPFSACSDELSCVKSLLDLKIDKIKQRLKFGTLLINAIKDQYFFDIKLTIPFDYPVQPVSIILNDTNIPKGLSTMFIAQATELARKCVEPPLIETKGKKEFIPAPSLKPVAEFLIEKCLRKSVTDLCPICEKLSLPPVPLSSLPQSESNHPVQVLCCLHLYHYDCLDHYMKSPPFVQNKKCLLCAKDIYNCNWKESRRLTEEKWVYTQAKNRELDDVADFFS